MTTDGGRRAIAAACALTASLALGACGGDDGSDLPEFDGSTSSAPTTTSAAPTTSTAPTTAVVPEARSLGDGETARGLDAAATPEEKAVSDVWFGYVAARMTAFATVDPTVEDLGKYAQGEALSSVVGYVNGTLKARKLHQVGGMVVAVNAVEIKGAQATVTSCSENASFNVTVEGNNPVEPLTPYYTVTGTLAERAGSWVVTAVKPTKVTSCPVR